MSENRRSQGVIVFDSHCICWNFFEGHARNLPVWDNHICSLQIFTFL